VVLKPLAIPKIKQIVAQREAFKNKDCLMEKIKCFHANNARLKMFENLSNQ
jgi:hypothetical protein